MPFILRGASLLGINSGESSNEIRDLGVEAPRHRPESRRSSRRWRAPSLSPSCPSVFDDYINAKVTRRIVVDLRD